MERLWTPWRATYVTGERTVEGCVFCAHGADGNDAANLVLRRGRHCFLIMNLFPYNSGHLMIVPYRHVADLAALTPDELQELTALLPQVTEALRTTLRAEGFNVGMNLGRAAGAGIADHLHLHVVPRWVGDTNFMPIVGATKVLPELLPATWARLRAALSEQATGGVAADGAAADGAAERQGRAAGQAMTPVAGAAAAVAAASGATRRPVGPPDDEAESAPPPAPVGPDAPSVPDDEEESAPPAPPAPPAPAVADDEEESAPPAEPPLAEPPPSLPADDPEGDLLEDQPAPVSASAGAPAAASSAASVAPPAAVSDDAEHAYDAAAPVVAAAEVLVAIMPADEPAGYGEPAAPTMVPLPVDEAVSAPEVVPAAPVAVQQAGAVVLLRDRVALRRAADGSWVLPKGHIEAGETLEQTAVREVAEEMGLDGRLGPAVAELRFLQGRRERHVTYFLFHADRPLPTWGDHLGRDTFLFPPRDALTRLTHPDARRLLEQALALDRGQGTR